MGFLKGHQGVTWVQSEALSLQYYLRGDRSWRATTTLTQQTTVHRIITRLRWEQKGLRYRQQTMVQSSPESRTCCIAIRPTLIPVIQIPSMTNSATPRPTRLAMDLRRQNVRPSRPIRFSVPTANRKTNCLLVVSGPMKFLLPPPSTNHSHSSITPFHFTTLTTQTIQTLLPFITTVPIYSTLSLPALTTQHHPLRHLTPH